MTQANQTNDEVLLAEYFLDCGRSGDLEGLFLTTTADLERCYGKNIYWGEVLGKHSDVTHENFKASDIVIRTRDQAFLQQMMEVLSLSPYSTISGYNPVGRILEQDSESTYDEDEEFED